MLNINLHANQRLIRWLCPSMKEKGQGWVLNINSTNGLHPSAGTPAYCASKWGMRGWSLSLHDVSPLLAAWVAIRLAATPARAAVYVALSVCRAHTRVCRLCEASLPDGCC